MVSMSEKSGDRDVSSPGEDALRYGLLSAPPESNQRAAQGRKSGLASGLRPRSQDFPPKNPPFYGGCGIGASVYDRREVIRIDFAFVSAQPLTLYYVSVPRTPNTRLARRIGLRSWLFYRVLRGPRKKPAKRFLWGEEPQRSERGFAVGGNE